MCGDCAHSACCTVTAQISFVQPNKRLSELCLVTVQHAEWAQSPHIIPSLQILLGGTFKDDLHTNPRYVPGACPDAPPVRELCQASQTRQRSQLAQGCSKEISVSSAW